MTRELCLLRAPQLTENLYVLLCLEVSFEIVLVSTLMVIIWQFLSFAHNDASEIALHKLYVLVFPSIRLQTDS